jgi:hypothetical protein
MALAAELENATSGGTRAVPPALRCNTAVLRCGYAGVSLVPSAATTH